MSAVRNFTQEQQTDSVRDRGDPLAVQEAPQSEPAGATFFNPVELTPDNIDDWLTGAAVYGAPLDNEPEENWARREEALFRILAINLYAQRGRDNGALHRTSVNRPLNGRTLEESRVIATQAAEAVPDATRMIIKAVARAIHEQAPERHQEASWELANALESSRLKYDTGQDGYEARRQKGRLWYGRIVADTLGIRLLGDNNS